MSAKTQKILFITIFISILVLRWGGRWVRFPNWIYVSLIQMKSLSDMPHARPSRQLCYICSANTWWGELALEERLILGNSESSLSHATLFGLRMDVILDEQHSKRGLLHCLTHTARYVLDLHWHLHATCFYAKHLYWANHFLYMFARFLEPRTLALLMQFSINWAPESLYTVYSLTGCI